MAGPTSWRMEVAPVIASLLLAGLLATTPLGAQLDLWLNDRLSRVAAPGLDTAHALVVSIDDESLGDLAPLVGAWPYGRDVWAHVVDYLREAGAARTVIDVVFADPRPGDEQLRQSIERTPQLVLAAVLAPEARTRDAASRTAIAGLGWRVPAGSPARSWADVSSPRPELMRAGGVAVASVQPDTDGVVRRVSLLHRVGDTYLPPLPLAALVDPLPEVRWQSTLAGGVLHVGGRRIAAGPEGDVELWLPAARAVPWTVSFARVARAALTTTPDPELIDLVRGRLVFVGASALLLDDAIQTPVGRLAGIDFVAMAEAALRHGQTLRPRARLWDALLVLAAVSTALFSSRARRAAPAGLVLAVPLAWGLTIVVALALLVTLHQRVGLVPPLVASASLVTLVGVQEVWRLRQEQQRLLVERLAVERAAQQKTQFLNHVAHELRTPVAAILGFSKLLSEDPGPSRTTQEYATVIARNASHLLQLVNNLLDAARLSIGRSQSDPHPTAVRQILRDVLATMEAIPRGPNVVLTAEVTPETPGRVLADDLRIRQVLLNLVGNAVKFTRVGSIRVTASWQQDVLTVSVDDTGPGIPADALEKIFEDFEFGSPAAARAGGSGLGLSVSRRLARLMGGDVTVVSDVGVGSRFDLVVPARAIDDEAAAVPGDSDAARVPVVVVCDDSEDIRQLFGLVLEDAGARVISTSDGDEAAAAVAREQPDVVLLDIDLPTVSGVRAMELMREAGYTGPVVAVTGAGEEHTPALLLARGFTDVIHKPMPVSRLLDAVARHVPGWKR